jgi:hypothetical protein
MESAVCVKRARSPVREMRLTGLGGIPGKARENRDLHRKTKIQNGAPKSCAAQVISWTVGNPFPTIESLTTKECRYESFQIFFLHSEL